VTGNRHARCEAGEKREITSNSYLSLYEVRSFVGWYRHITLVLLALAYLAGICATERSCPGAPTAYRPGSTPAVLALTVPEVRHLLAWLIWPASSSARRVLECRVVAARASKPCELLPYQTSSEGWLIPASSVFSTDMGCPSALLPNLRAISWKYWSSGTCPGSVVRLVSSFNLL
jgi:hypothetical protein